LPKPKGTIGGTKMKIMALICYNSDCGMESYGYNIWQSLKSNFHIYLNNNDIRNVYHHLRGLCDLDLLSRVGTSLVEADNRCYYNLTEKGLNLKHKYQLYLNIVQRNLDNT